MDKHALLYGREITLRELNTLVTFNEQELGSLVMRSALTKINSGFCCERCGTLIQSKKPFPCICGKECVYCQACLMLGKLRECDSLVTLKEPNLFSCGEKSSLKWTGHLSDQQKQASKEICQSMEQNTERVVWAVTGAGKTEMLFEGIGRALDNQKRVCIASPRIDVCLELEPRLRQAFSETSLAVLYGHSERKYDYTQLVIATTHQLLRFKEAFDILIIDEIDAFPFFNNEMLYYALKKAVKQEASIIYLTATPDTTLKKKIKTKKLEASILPARFHGHPLPLPSVVLMKNQLAYSENPSDFYLHIKNLVNKSRKFLLFVPTIKLLKQITEELKHHFNEKTFASVYSEDSKRHEKIKQMRLGQYDFLISTTILERGVTFIDIDVIVIHSEHKVFSEAALIQIAGRVGRSMSFPSGNVTFYCSFLTREIKNAVKEIEKMNHLAKQKGLLK